MVASYIPTIMEKPSAMSSDCDAVADAVAMGSFNISEWLATLPSSKLQE